MSETKLITVNLNLAPTKPKDRLSRVEYFTKLNDKKVFAKPELNFDHAEINTLIDGIPQSTIDDYTKYWKDLTPKTDQEYYDRWIFAFLSVHCGWKANVKGFLQISQEKNLPNVNALRDVIQISGVGLITMRTKGIWKFKEDFNNNPSNWRKKPNETWDAFRHRTMNMAHGLGYAKTAFAIELCYPLECEVTCLDTHMLQLYGYKPKVTPSPSKYKTLEQHWVARCKSRGIPAFMARNVYWDKVQSQKDTRYWSYVFETSRPSGQSIVSKDTPIQVQQQAAVQNSEPVSA